MSYKIKISLRLPDAKVPDSHFSLRLNTELQIPSCIYNNVPKLFVVSGIKGNLRSLYTLLIKHRIIDRHFQWTFDDGHLVVVGNCFDSTEPAVECLWFIYSLEQKAKAKKGCVHCLLGAYEIMQINGNWQYEHPPYASAKAKVRSPFTALYDANLELRRWLGNRNIIEKIGNLLFVDGDILLSLDIQNYTLLEINSIARSFYVISSQKSIKELSNPLFASKDIFSQNLLDKRIMFSEKIINTISSKFSIDTIITGHTTQEQITSFFKGKLINVTTNHSSSNSEGLLIKQGIFSHANRQGHKKELKLNLL